MPWLLCVGMTLWAYAPALTAGFMYDDPLDLPRATTRSVLDILTSPGSSSYYRPLPLLVWHALHALLGRNDPVLLHTLGLACHAVSGWLVLQLASRLLDRRAGFVAAMLFLWYPPSYQVVGFVNVFFHALATTWVLAAAVLFWDARQRQDRGRLTLSLACGALGLLSHESAVAIVPITIGIEGFLFSRGASRRPSPAVLFYVVEVLGYLALWLAMPRLPISSELGLASLASNGLYFLQGLTAPVAMHLGRFPQISGSSTLTLLTAAAATLALLMGLLAARRRVLVGAFGAAWFLVTVAPSWLLLPWENYVSNAPRLLYLPSAGMAILWAAALTPPPLSTLPTFWLGGRRMLNRAGAVLPVLLIGAILGTSFRFISIRESVQTQGADIMAQVIASARQNGLDAHATYVNVPSFLTPRETDFLFGHWGITIIPQYVYDLGFAVYIAEGAKPPISSVAFSVLAHDWEHFYGNHGYGQDVQGLEAPLRAGGPVFVTRYDPGRLRLEYVGRVTGGAQPATGLARFSDWAELVEGTAQRGKDGANGSTLNVRLLWRAASPAPSDYTVFVHVVDAAGAALAQADGYPIAAMFPTQKWRSGDQIEDVRSIRLPAGAKPAAVLIGLYDRANPTIRATASNPQGSRLADDAVRLGIGGLP